jgi:hypothetical protein
MSELSIFLPLFGILALLFVFYKNAWVSKQDPGNEKMQFIASNIAKGAMAFLKAEYKVLSVFVIAVAILLIFKGNVETNGSPFIALSFIVGALCSGLAGFIGMVVATKANVRTTNAARSSLGKGLEVVRTFAFVATTIPIKPASPEHNAPTINDSAINGLPLVSTLPLNISSIATAITKTDNTLYSAFKNAIAPFAILLAINCIFSLPGSCLETHAFL